MLTHSILDLVHQLAIIKRSLIHIYSLKFYLMKFNCDKIEAESRCSTTNNVIILIITTHLKN